MRTWLPDSLRARPGQPEASHLSPSLKWCYCQGADLERIRWCWDHLAGIRDWTQLRPLYKLANKIETDSKIQRAGWQLSEEMGIGGLGEKGEGINQKKESSQTQITVWRLPDEGGVGRGRKGGKGDQWWQEETWLGVVNTQYNIQMVCYRIVHLKPM